MSLRSWACSAVRVLPFLQMTCGAVRLGTPLTIDVASPSLRSCGSIECGNGESGSLYIRTGPTGSVTSFEAMLPARAKSGFWNDSNHSIVSFGEVSVKKRPVGPVRC